MRAFLKALSSRSNKNKLDDYNKTILHAKIIQENKFLKETYIDFYNKLKRGIHSNTENKRIIELGSGGGFIKKIIPNAITSDIIKIPENDLNFSALAMPFKNEEVDAFVMIDVMHHSGNAKLFFKEIARCLKKGGTAVMVEPANTFWGRFIWKNFHHEDFNPKGKWEFKQESPLKSANGALPWIIFRRDKSKFLKLFPNLKIVEIRAHTPFRYIISGGLSFPQLLPSFTYPLIVFLEKLLSPLNNFIGMFYTIKILKE